MSGKILKKRASAAAITLIAALLGGCPAFADGLKVITGAGMAAPLRAIAADFAKRSGFQVTVVSDTTGGVQKRLESGEKADLILVTSAVMDNLAKENLVAGPRADIARVMAGVAVKRGAPEPDISSSEAVKKSLLAAKSISYVDPAAGGITGPYFVALCRRLGILGQVAAKAVLKKTGGEVAAAVANGESELGVTLVSEMLSNPGISVAGPLPQEIQIDSVYVASLAKDVANPEAAKKLLAQLRSVGGQTSIRTAGLIGIAQ